MRGPRPEPLAALQRAELAQLEQRLVRAALTDFGVFLYGSDGPPRRPDSQTTSLSQSRPPSSPRVSHSSGSASGGPPNGADRPHRALILDSRYWKRVKSAGSLTAYKAREHIEDKSAFATAALAQLPRPHPHPRGGVSALPRPTPVAVVGSVSGSLADVLYGLLAPCTPDLLLRAAHCGHDPGPTRVLACIQQPSEDEPFRCANVVWTVRGQGGKRGHPAEFVELEATGMVDHLVGFHVRCSVPWGEPWASQDGLPRAWAASVALFRESGGGRLVDVCARSLLSQAGGAVDVRAAAALTLADVGEAARCGQAKKLSWLVLDRIRARDGGELLVPTGEHPTTRLGGHVPPATRPDMRRCGACDKRFGPLSSVATCAMCALQMCSKCRLARPLRAVVRADVADIEGEAVEPRPVTLCKPCGALAESLDARTAAEAEALQFAPTKLHEEEEEDEDIEQFGWERESSAGPRESSASHRQSVASHRESMGRPSMPVAALTDEGLGTWTPTVVEVDDRPRVVLFSGSSGPGARTSSGSTSVVRSSSSTVAVSIAGPVSTSSSWIPSPSASDASSAWSDSEEVDEEIDTAAYYHPPHLEDELSGGQLGHGQPQYPTGSQQDLWRTMAALRVAAESTYQLTRQLAAQNSSQQQQHTQPPYRR